MAQVPSESFLFMIQQLQALAQTGLTYSKDPYDLERFEAVRKISTDMMSLLTTHPVEELKDLFANETGYQTPKVDIRAVVFREGKILLVQEKMDEKWALPGGWADIGLSPTEVAEKETQEEAGLKVQAQRLLGIWDRSRHPHPQQSDRMQARFRTHRQRPGH